MNLINWQHIRCQTGRAILLGVFSVFIIGCDGNESPSNPSPNSTSEPEPATSTSAVIKNTANHSIYLPSSVDTTALNGDVDGFFTSAGTNSLPNSSASINDAQDSAKKLYAADLSQSMAANTSASDVTGFIVERPAFNGEANSGQVLAGFEALILADTTTVASLTSTGLQSFAALGATVSAYNLTLSYFMQPTDVANNLIQYLGVNSQFGTITGLPAASANEPFATDYTLFISVAYYSASDIVVAVVLVPANLAGTYAAVTGAISSPTNVGQAGASTTMKTDSFTAQGGGGLADFLFVIDNSGSMAGDQAAVSAAASAFDTAITNSGLNYRIGTITTDSSTLRDSYADGDFTADITEFTQDVVVGTSGSATETGIWFAEQSLQSTALSDGADGSVTAAGYPRVGASLSVIILSDERSQYTSRSGGIAFDAANNLFIDRGYRVYAMIEPSDPNSQYDDLALASGGSVADIADQGVFSTIMSNIATNAGGASSQFALTETPIASTINVTVNGTSVANSAINGWAYNASSNSVVFHGSALLSGGESVSVTYDYFVVAATP